MAAGAPLLPELCTASSQGWTVEVRRLLVEGADIEERGKRGETPLFAAASAGHEDVMRVLFEHGADVSAVRLDDVDGRTMLHQAVFRGQSDIVPLLLEQGAEVSARDSRGSTPLHWAVIDGRHKIVLLLLEKGADIEDRAGEQERSPLHVAATAGEWHVADLLLRKGADLLGTDSAGWTALHYAAHHGHSAFVRMLLDKGADEQSKANDGVTPEDLATRGHSRIIRSAPPAGGSRLGPPTLCRSSSSDEHKTRLGGVVAMLKAEAVRRAKWVAFAMGHHPRLGEGSRALELEVGVVRTLNPKSYTRNQKP